MSWRSGTEVVIDILCRVPPLLVLDKIFCFRFDDDAALQEILLWIFLLFICKYHSASGSVVEASAQRRHSLGVKEDAFGIACNAVLKQEGMHSISHTQLPVNSHTILLRGDIVR
ncbi:hypothetical protein BaRGS_00037164 [Batillaria attramentaria]|uniref:Uncharacterized protein n=1 Tax=Batillaria attramentaria TaxID=370345 RepID=A0ABD0J9Q6_9CAEN